MLKICHRGLLLQYKSDKTATVVITITLRVRVLDRKFFFKGVFYFIF